MDSGNNTSSDRATIRRSLCIMVQRICKFSIFFSLYFICRKNNYSLIVFGTQGRNNLPRDSHLYYLSQGPFTEVRSYNVCFVNGYKFHTDSYGKSKSTVNSGVCIRGSNYSYDEDDFYGILKEIVEVE